jgi:hypothetical protein
MSTFYPAFEAGYRLVFLQKTGLTLLLLFWVYIVHAQVTDTTSEDIMQQKIATMHDILSSIEELRKDLGEKEREYQQASTVESKEAIDSELTELRKRIENRENDFSTLSTGIDQETFFELSQSDLKWEDEVQDIFSPLLYELKDITARPREMEKLRNSIPFFRRRVEEITKALSNIDTLSALNTNKNIGDRLTELARFWEWQQVEHQTELETMELQLEKLEKERKSFGEALGEVSGVFFRNRGKNLLIALLVFAFTFFSLRFLHRFISQKIKLKRLENRRFLLRLTNIIYYLFTLLASIALFMSVLYLASDWVILGLSIFLLFGLIWAGKNALPSLLVQARLLLNLGSVREGERLVYNHVPWLVKSLNFYSELENPELEGGWVRLPIKDLIDMRSRPFSPEEPWFPTTKGDWVKLSDGFYGKIFLQTPEAVGIETQRGAYKTYPVAEFLSNRPQNLSRNYFSVNRTIGIDYRYRHQVNDEIAPAMKAYFEEAIQKEWYGEYIAQIIVELRELRASSLGIICILKFTGEAASEYFEIGWKIEQIALDALNTLDIDIPFPHLKIVREEDV